MEGEVGCAAELFGGGVGGGADNGVEQGELALSANRAHEAEVHNLDVQITAGADDHDIGGFEVTVDELMGVDVFECGADLVEEGGETGQGEALIGLSAAELIERFAFNIFHDEVGIEGVLVMLKDTDDVGVIELAESSKFAFEADLMIFGELDSNELLIGEALGEVD